MRIADMSVEDMTSEWRIRAACHGADAELFFPVGSTGPAVGYIAAAKAICRQCPVQGECLEFAIATRQPFGIWGGTDEEERRVFDGLGSFEGLDEAHDEK